MLNVLKHNGGGHHTSANAVNGYGEKMLQGDQKHSDPVVTVATVEQMRLNLSPTVDNIFEIVKEINGKGEAANSFLGEVWSSRVATALYEHEQVLSIQNNDNFEAKTYPSPALAKDNQLALQFQAVANHMMVSCGPSSSSHFCAASSLT